LLWVKKSGNDSLKTMKSNPGPSNGHSSFGVNSGSAGDGKKKDKKGTTSSGFPPHETAEETLTTEVGVRGKAGKGVWWG